MIPHLKGMMRKIDLRLSLEAAAQRERGTTRDDLVDAIEGEAADIACMHALWHRMMRDHCLQTCITVRRGNHRHVKGQWARRRAGFFGFSH